MTKQYFKYDRDGYYVGSVIADYNTKNPKPSNVTDIKPADGMYKAKFDGHKWVDTIEDLPVLQKGISAKLNELNEACTKTITAGVDVETSIGVKHFSLTEIDQINLSGLSDQLNRVSQNQPSKINLEKGIPYHADGELCRFWPVEDFVKIVKIGMEFVIYNQTYVNHLREHVKNVKQLYELDEIIYGMELPAYLQESLNNLLDVE